MKMRRLARAAGQRLRRAQTAVLWSGAATGGLRRAGVANAERNADDVLRFNLDEVTAALSAAGLDYFIVPELVGQTPRVGLVADRDTKLAVMRALAAHAGRAPLYVTARGLPAARADRADDRYLLTAQVATVFTRHEAAGGRWVMGIEYGTQIEFWDRVDGGVAGPRPNAVSSRVPLRLTAPRDVEVLGERHRSWAAFDCPDHVDRPPFDVDLVYTWVDGADPAWQQRQQAARAAAGDLDWHPDAANAARYRSRDELRYSLRSVWLYASFFRRIHIVTDQQVPSWLDTSHPRIRVVDHTEILDGAARLPTFNSHVIESRLHHIPELAEHFVYANDDMFFGRRAVPQWFFLPNGISRFVPSPVVLDESPPRERDNPAEVAAKNNRALLRQRCPNLEMHKIRHAPYPLRRSVLSEMEAAYPEQFADTASHQFRHPHDHSVASSLYHYYAYITRRAVPHLLTFRYVDISAMGPVELAARLRELQWSRPELFCINDVSGEVPQASDRRVDGFLESMFPVPSPYER